MKFFHPKIIIIWPKTIKTYCHVPTHGDTIRVQWVGLGWVILRASGQEEGELAFKIFACIWSNA